MTENPFGLVSSGSSPLSLNPHALLGLRGRRLGDSDDAGEPAVRRQEHHRFAFVLQALCVVQEPPHIHSAVRHQLAAAQERNLDLPDPDSFQAIPRHGVEARFGLSELILGNGKLMAERGVDVGRLSPEAERLENEGKTVMFLAADGRLAGVIAVAEAAAAKTQQRMGIEGQGR